MKKTIICFGVFVSLLSSTFNLAAQTEFPTLEQALSHTEEQLRPSLRYLLEKQINATPASTLRKVYAVVSIESQQDFVREQLSKHPISPDQKTKIIPLDVSNGLLGDCKALLAYPRGKVVERDGTLNGFRRFFQCPGDEGLIRLSELAWQDEVTNAFTIRELTTTDLDVGGVSRRAVLVRNLDPRKNAVTRLSWRHGDRLVELSVTGIDSAQEKRLRDIARSL